jgi:hypothetical protein
MKQLTLLLLILLTTQLNAKMLISPSEAMQANFGEKTKIVKKNILLKKEQVKNVQKSAKVKLKSKIFKTFKAINGKKIIGYGIIVNRKVRSKNAVVLYMISKDGVLKSMEIIAFNEPMEYIPSKTWQEQFKEIPTTKKLRLNKDIPTITGATLSAKSIVDGSRIAFAFYDEVLKGK